MTDSTDQSPPKVPRARPLLHWRSIRDLVLRTLDQDLPPRRLALSFSLGIFCGILPFPGHTVVVTLLALVLRLNVVAAITGAWINIAPLWPISYGLAFFIGEVVTGIPLPKIDWKSLHQFSTWWSLFRTFYVPMSVGTTIVGTVWAATMYPFTLRAARRLRARREARAAGECSDADAKSTTEVPHER